MTLNLYHISDSNEDRKLALTISKSGIITAMVELSRTCQIS